MSRVFKMNDCDWVYADCEEQAIDFYEAFSGCNKSEIEIEEVSLKDTMYYEVSRLPMEEQQMTLEMQWFAGKLCVKKSFEWVIEHENIKAPAILATVEGY